jgi:colicin import membrane protein
MMRGMIAASALMIAATPALAGDEERARAAIAEAQGKIDAAGRVNANQVSPDAVARAQASLRLAQEELKSGHEQKAIQAAIESQQFADSAIGRTQQRQNAAADAQAGAVADAQAQAAAATARADAAEQAAAAAAADAQAARNAPPVVIAPTPTPTTTVTTETVRTAPAATRTSTAVRRPVKKTVKRTTTAARPVVTEKTTTTVVSR